MTVIRFKRDYEMLVNGQMRNFAKNEEVEVGENVAIDLIKKMICLPAGPQFGKAVRALK